MPTRHEETGGKTAQERMQESADAQLRRQRLVREIAGSDLLLAQQLQQLSGLDHLPLIKSSGDEVLIEQMARKVPSELLDMMHVAATQQAIDFDLKMDSERVESLYPTRDIEPVPMSDMGQMTEVLPEQLMSPTFYQDLAQDDLTILQSYEQLKRRKELYVLEDLSGSMDRLMASGIARYIWAHGISINLARRALAGEAVFCRREFDGKPHALIEVKTSEDAKHLIQRVTQSKTTNGGTHILSALAQAASDIRSRGAGDLGTDILLITDGEDESSKDPEVLRALLGDDIRLHVAIIGASSPSLQTVATTYRVFA